MITTTGQHGIAFTNRLVWPYANTFGGTTLVFFLPPGTHLQPSKIVIISLFYLSLKIYPLYLNFNHPNNSKLVSMSCEPVSAINYYEDLEPPIEIRVIKKWVPYKKRKWIPPKKSTKLCYLFVDIHGDAIEAIAHIDSQSYFDSIITVQSCYIVNNYISQPQRRYMPAVPHKASIRFGRRASFVPITNCNIPDHYYNFADFKVLEIRMRPQKMLTGSPRLVTTPATTVVLNPTSVDTASHVYRLQQLPKMTADNNTVTIAQLLTKNVHEHSTATGTTPSALSAPGNCIQFAQDLSAQIMTTSIRGSGK
ncbi:hypothetical protein M8C21_004497 [Ambrosia artemisiifolia]|uniref:Uncharacterized protein n=1 Tax=Ambrosia artemisiifolia TaxID=4212 RepID=A0AAD5CVQ8_AMBAR|nr:hypothetical protein M8C21_004497 [Ambrosia artemisiifolia]